MELSAHFKQSEAGIIPVDWTYSTLGELASASSGTTPRATWRTGTTGMALFTGSRRLAFRLGNTGTAVRNWKIRKTVTERQIAGLVHSASRAGAISLQETAIRPLVEFFPITKRKSKQRAKYELFGIGASDVKKPSYLQGLRRELEEHHGVYVFFDSRGQAIYTGKARLQSLWKEMNLAFNRERGEVQKIKQVKHPTRNVAYRTSNEKARQIRDHVVPLHELATYFSAYHVADSMINVVEAMLVRSFANDLLSKRMEQFGQPKKRRKLA
ncbi:MAG: hypothetical protein ABI900_12690 [Betaproteobacteria bacterium]